MPKSIRLKNVCFLIIPKIYAIGTVNSHSENVFILLVGAGTNKQHQTTKNTAKLDRESEELKHDKIPLDVGKIIQQGRQNKGLSQKDLATVSVSLFLIKIVDLRYIFVGTIAF